MNWPRRLLSKKKLERQLDSELEFHLERQAADNMRAGMSAEDARRDALLKFGGIEQAREECRDARGTVWLESLLQDLRYALRTLRKSPGFAAAAIGTLALGIGANTAIFQLIDAVRLRTLPVPEPQSLAVIRIPNGNEGMGLNNEEGDLTYPLWQEIREHQQAFSGVFAWSSNPIVLGRGADHWVARGLWVSGEMFPVLGLTPYRGRLFNARDDHAACGAGGVVISYSLWQGRFGGRDSAIGSSLVINERSFEVIGVTPPSFAGLDVGRSFDFALPLCAKPAMWPGDESLTRRDEFWLRIMGRLKPGWTLSRASKHLTALSPGLFDVTAPVGYPAATVSKYRKFRLAAYPAANGLSGLRNSYDAPLRLLLGITGLVLLIACTNIGNLMLARATAREREIAVRLAIGASRGRIVRQLVSEGLVVAAGGAAIGIYLARFLSGAIVWFLSGDGGAIRLDLSMDWRVLGFTGAVAVVTCIVFALAPALRLSRTKAETTITAGARGLTANRDRFSFQRFLVAGQIAISTVLLVSALLFVRSFRNLTTLDPGFREDGVLVSYMSLLALHLSPDRHKLFEQQLVEEIKSIPGVESAALSTHPLLNGSSWTLGVNVNAAPGHSKFTWVSAQYLETLGTALIAGRDFNAGDTANSRRVAIVNQTFVRRFLHGADPIGQLVRTVSEPSYPAAQYEIIGVAKDSKYADLREEIPPQAFAPISQFPSDTPWEMVLIHSTSPLSAIASALKKRIGELHPDIVMEARPLRDEVEGGLIRERLMAALSGFFGILAALLASIGLYGVISYIVVRRRNEIGIRMALGARRQRVIGMIMREAVWLLAFGLAGGLLLSFAATTTASALLFGVKAHDPLTFCSAGLLLALITAAASFWPARRASRLDPMSALRWE